MNNLIEIKGLSKTYGRKKVLDDLNISISCGKIIGLLGPNASGKSTLIKIINGLLQPTSGSVTIDGEKPGVHTKSIISYLPEKPYTNNELTVRQLVSLFKDFYSDFNEEKAYQMLYDLKVDPNSKIKTLSKGTKEKVQLILVMSRHAKLYILDEPISGVDPAARSYVIRTIINNYPPESTIIIVTHLISEIEHICDEVCFLNNGKIVLYEDTDTIRVKNKTSVDALFREEFKC